MSCRIAISRCELFELASPLPTWGVSSRGLQANATTKNNFILWIVSRHAPRGRSSNTTSYIQFLKALQQPSNRPCYQEHQHRRILATRSSMAIIHCPRCPATFATNHDRARQILNTHDEYLCWFYPGCFTLSMSEQELKLHVSTVHFNVPDASQKFLIMQEDNMKEHDEQEMLAREAKRQRKREQREESKIRREDEVDLLAPPPSATKRAALSPKYVVEDEDMFDDKGTTPGGSSEPTTHLPPQQQGTQRKGDPWGLRGVFYQKPINPYLQRKV
ncbi:uncharacterized protein LTR77_007169 [Saxophila tyrrhenica]|uniref:C2H2-type domain-containing protein n=1 Tax=Saxophila tyrrhenica TaxID=1690608 RepID=A0AAV9P7Z6_9PEZI|nr:hypothetical protein LTR77_007169 [Saxophila tyrrhenica]